MTNLTKETEKQLVKEFKEGTGVTWLAIIYKITEREVENILRKYVKVGGK